MNYEPNVSVSGEEAIRFMALELAAKAVAPMGGNVEAIVSAAKLFHAFLAGDSEPEGETDEPVEVLSGGRIVDESGHPIGHEDETLTKPQEAA